MADAAARALDDFIERILAATRQRHGRLPRQLRDPEWPSPCQVGAPASDGQGSWQPLRRDVSADFSGLANALDSDIHPDWQLLLSRYWSDHLPASGSYGRLELLQLWNPADEERMVANQIGHALQRARRHQPLTLFIACSDDPDLVYSIENATGKVLKENLARSSEREIAATLAEFVSDLEPLALD